MIKKLLSPKKQPIVAHIMRGDLKKERRARLRKEVSSMNVIADAIHEIATAGRASLAATKALVSTAKATNPTKVATLVPAVAPAAHVDLGGTYHSFVNLLPGTLFTWDKSVNMPGIYIKWIPHFYRKLNDGQSYCIQPLLAGVQCYHLPEAEILDRLKGFLK